MLNIANHPSHIQSRCKYISFGEKTYLEHGDVIYVILYDATTYDETDIQNIIRENRTQERPNISILKQKVLGNV